MNICLEGKVALVTGAGAGIGLATARAFAQAGAAVVLADVNGDAVRRAADGLLAAGHKALAVRCNVADKSEVAAMVDRTVSAFGRLDAAYNNAGVNCDGVDMLHTGDDEFERILDVNLRGVAASLFPYLF
jgi:NAD(P)-dependent dehydrogenase (short-subunit alcohol dehydrogenase family)